MEPWHYWLAAYVAACTVVGAVACLERSRTDKTLPIDRLPREQPTTTAWERANAEGLYADMQRAADARRSDTPPPEPDVFVADTPPVELVAHIRHSRDLAKRRAVADLEQLWLLPPFRGER